MEIINWNIVLNGLLIGFGLIIAIGAQNAFVLRQGLKKNHVFVSAFISSLGDSILIILGVGGLGSMIAGSQLLSSIAAWGGGLFLIIYGIRSFLSNSIKDDDEDGAQTVLPTTITSTVFSSLAFSFLNPHVYIDTVVLIGSLGSQYPSDERWLFASGAVLSSWIWFFSLAYGARVISPWFEKPKAEQILNVVIGVIMWVVAYSLLKNPVLEILRNVT